MAPPAAPKTPQDAPRPPQERPRPPQERPKSPQERSKNDPRSPNTAPRTTKSAQDRPMTAQDRPKTAQERKKTSKRNPPGDHLFQSFPIFFAPDRFPPPGPPPWSATLQRNSLRLKALPVIRFYLIFSRKNSSKMPQDRPKIAPKSLLKPS